MTDAHAILGSIAFAAALLSGCGREAGGGGDGAPDASSNDGCRVYVDGSLEDFTGHDGSSWELALANVQEGLDAAEAATAGGPSSFPTCEVWVAAGTYLPTADSTGSTEPGGARTKTFHLVGYVALYGGFAGDETSLDQRDIAAHETVLSGDLGTAGDNSGNSYNVVTGAGASVIDGFTISGGNANVYGTHDFGGGMINIGIAPTVANCTFKENFAMNGGGMYNEEASPLVTNCVFEGNSISGFYGGGMYNLSSAPIVLDCAFTGNFTDVQSAGVGQGGGMANEYSAPFVERCSFEGNTAVTGGGMFNLYSYPIVSDCRFEGNSAEGYGGGMHNYDSLPLVIGCSFVGNTADSNGGGMGNESSSTPIVTNCIFVDNTSQYGGGSMINTEDSSPIVTNCTFLRAATDTEAIMYNSYSAPIVTNCVFWGGAATADAPVGPVASVGNEGVVTYSDVQGGCTVEEQCTPDDTGNIDADPLFVDAASGDLRLSPESPCIDSGSTAALPEDWADLDGDGDASEPLPLDFDGNPRVAGAAVDMGAYEFQP